MIVVNQEWNARAKECRDGRVAIISSPEYKEIPPILHKLALDHNRTLKGPKVILHVMPLFALKTQQERSENPPYTGSELSKKLGQPKIQPLLRPLSKRHFAKVTEPIPSAYGLTYWFDGVASIEVFNTGVIESIDYGKESFIDAGSKILPLDELYKECSETIKRFILILKELNFLDIDSTIYAFLTLIGVKEFTLDAEHLNDPRRFVLNGRVFDDQDCKADAYFQNDTVPSSDVISQISRDMAEKMVIEKLSTCTREAVT